MGWLIPIIRMLRPRLVIRLKDVGQAMINVALRGYEKNILEVPDIVKAAVPSVV
jgi:hypothetical protein